MTNIIGIGLILLTVPVCGAGSALAEAQGPLQDRMPFPDRDAFYTTGAKRPATGLFLADRGRGRGDRGRGGRDRSRYRDHHGGDYDHSRGHGGRHGGDYDYSHRHRGRRGGDYDHSHGHGDYHEGDFGHGRRDLDRDNFRGRSTDARRDDGTFHRRQRDRNGNNGRVER